MPRIAVTLPSGWFNYNGWAVNDGGPLGLAFWDVAQVYPTGCRWQGKPMIDPGRTVDGLARVLAARPLRHASRPTDVVLAGFRGKYLRWSVPSKINFSRCGQGYFESWRGRGWATDRWQQGPGQVDRLWILDVEGHRLVIDANYMPSATRKQRAELERIVHSIKFLAVSSLGTIHAGAAGSSASPGCAQLRQLKSVFPRASAVGFRGRQAISFVRHPRQPIWPGRCGGFFTIYRRYTTGSGELDISVTLYKAPSDLSAPLAEPEIGRVRKLSNGARARTYGPTPMSVNGSPASETDVVSAYRRIFISSVSISLAKTPVPIAAQLRVHRQIEAAFRALGAVPGLEARGPAALPGTSRGGLSPQLELQPAVVRLRGRDNVVVSRLPVDSLQVLPVGALEQGGQAFRWRSLRPVHGTWVITLPAPLLRGIYPLRLRTRAGSRSFRSARWFLRVFPAGTLSLPSFENPRDVMRWWSAPFLTARTSR